MLPFAVAAEKQQIPVGTAKAVASGTYGPATWANVHYYLLGDVGAHTPGEVISSVAQAEHELYENGLVAAGRPSDWHMSFTTVTYRDAADSIVRVRVADAQAGSNGSGNQDAQVALLVNWATSDPRRGGKPRTYVSGVADNHMQDTARLTSSFQGTINAALITWLSSLPTPAGARLVPMQLVEMSFRNGKVWRDSPVHYPIIGGTLNPVVASQRRRVDRLRI